MRTLHSSLLLAFLLTPCLPSQAPDRPVVQVQGFEWPASPPSTSDWTDEIADPYTYAALQFQAPQDEFTILFVHTGLDITEKTGDLAAGVLLTYPFLNLAEGHTLSALDGASSQTLNVTVDTAHLSDPLHIPPQEIFDYLELVASSPDPSQFGFPQQAGYRVFSPPSNWGTGPAEDDRRAFGNPGWINLSAFGNIPADYIGELGRKAAFQQAVRYYGDLGKTLSQQAADDLAEQLRQEIGFEMYVQAISVPPPSTWGGHVRVKVSQPAIMRKHSFRIEENLWLTYGGSRRLVSLSDPTTSLYLATLGGEMHLHFAEPVSDLTAWVETLTRGLVPLTQRLPTVPPEGAPAYEIDSTIAVFDYPPDGKHGHCIVLDSANQPVVPLGNLQGVAIVIASPPAQPE